MLGKDWQFDYATRNEENAILLNFIPTYFGNIQFGAYDHFRKLKMMYGLNCWIQQNDLFGWVKPIWGLWVM